MSRPRLGFLGTGWIGRHRMAALAATGLAEIVAVAEPDDTCAAEALALAPAAKRVDGLDALLREDIDAVVIATPSAAHAEQSIAALEAGKAVFCQKPLGRTGPEVAEVVEFTLAGHEVIGLNAGPQFHLNEAFSFYLRVDGQEEVDRYWDILTADGGEPGPCGWCKDRFGISWQVIPRELLYRTWDYLTGESGATTTALREPGGPAGRHGMMS